MISGLPRSGRFPLNLFRFAEPPPWLPVQGLGLRVEVLGDLGFTGLGLRGLGFRASG